VEEIMSSDEKKNLRSRDWFGRRDKAGFIHRSWMKNQGFPNHSFDGRPVVGICNTWSELNPCNAHFRELAEAVKRGVYEAGGLPVVIQELKAFLHLETLTVNGRTLGENTAGAPCYNRNVIASIDQPLIKEAGIAVLRGNLCQAGAVIKPSAASPELMQHRGRAVVFEDIEDYHHRIDRPELDVDANCVLVLKGVGPRGYPGMPEVGNMGLPKRLLAQGVEDMVRISDGRMSGTAFGTVVLHVSPESAVGGNLALVQKTGPPGCRF
jgi:dihydroxy-acid dehydratase